MFFKNTITSYYFNYISAWTSWPESSRARRATIAVCLQQHCRPIESESYLQSSNTGQTINLAPKERKPSRYLHLKITCLPRAHKSAILMGLFWPIFAAKLMSSLLYQWYPAMLGGIHVMISIYTWFNLSRHVPLMVSGTLLKAISTLNKQIFG